MQTTQYETDAIIIRNEEVKEGIENFDKQETSVPEGIWKWALKNCAEELRDPLYIIFQKSLNQWKLPELWDKANPVPLYKKGRKNDGAH